MAGDGAGKLLDWLFPPRCVACGQRGEWFCSSCRGAVLPVRAPWCHICGQALTVSNARGTVCQFCASSPLRINGIRAVGPFVDPLRKAIHAFKYRNLRALASPLGALLADHLDRHPLPVDLIVPVPLHPRRLRARGYNQAGLLAQCLAEKSKLALAEKALVRARPTRSQIGLDAVERRANVLGAFACADGQVAGRRVLLVDDVCTTGATLESCAGELYHAGAAAVWGLTLARE
ncbi:MAG: ComF family protein [Chloroflexota bacterium]